VILRFGLGLGLGSLFRPSFHWGFLWLFFRRSPRVSLSVYEMENGEFFFCVTSQGLVVFFRFLLVWIPPPFLAYPTPPSKRPDVVPLFVFWHGRAVFSISSLGLVGFFTPIRRVAK